MKRDFRDMEGSKYQWDQDPPSAFSSFPFPFTEGFEKDKRRKKEYYNLE